MNPVVKRSNHHRSMGFKLRIVMSRLPGVLSGCRRADSSTLWISRSSSMAARPPFRSSAISGPKYASSCRFVSATSSTKKRRSSTGMATGHSLLDAMMMCRALGSSTSGRNFRSMLTVLSVTMPLSLSAARGSPPQVLSSAKTSTLPDRCSLNRPVRAVLAATTFWSFPYEFSPCTTWDAIGR